MHAQGVLDRQADLADHLREPFFLDYMLKGLAAKRDVKWYGPVLLSAVLEAPAYRVSSDLSTLIEFAASQLDDTDVWDADQAPTRHGFVRFDNPLTVYDTHGQAQKAHWMLWGPSFDAGTLIYLWNDHDDPDESALAYIASAQGVGELGAWGSIGGHASVPAGSPLGGATLHWSTYDAGLSDAPTVGPFGALAPRFTEPTNMKRYVHALWLLMQQSAVETEGEHLRKTGMRAARKAGLNAPTMRVVRLRRSAASRGTGESAVAWANRWVVRGHWRWQAHGVGRTERKRIWVDPYIKGPEGAPIVVTTKVYDVR